MALTRITKGVIKPNENYDTHDINSTGIITATALDISGNASIGGVLTYEDVTSIDSVGIITAQNGIDCNADLDVDGHTNLDNVSVAGVSTFSGVINATGGLVGNATKITLTSSTANSSLPVLFSTGVIGSSGADTLINSSKLTFNPSSGTLGVNGNLSIAEKIIHTGDTNCFISFPAADQIVFEGGGHERFRINGTTGKYLFGRDITGRTAHYNNTGVVPTIQIEDDTEASFSVAKFSNNTDSSRIYLQKGRGSTGSAAKVQDGDTLGMIVFNGYNGSGFRNAAQITAEVDGDPATGNLSTDMPGALVFKTSADQTNVPAERLRISSSGYVNIGPAADARKRLDITGPDGRSGASSGNSDTALLIDNDGVNGAIIEMMADNNAYGRIFFTDTDTSNQGQIVYEHGNDAFQFSTDGTERLRIHSSGKLETKNTFTSSAATFVHIGDNEGYFNFDMSDSSGGSDFIKHVKKRFVGKNTYGLTITSRSTLGGSYTKAGEASIKFYYPSAGGGNQAGGQLEFWTNQNGYAGTTEAKRMQISNSGNIGAPNGNNIYNASDERLKENMVELTNGLDKIKKLKPISFNWKDGWDECMSGKKEYGFGAQTTQVVDEMLVEAFGTEDTLLNGEVITNPLRVNEKYIIPLLVKAMQEQQEQIETLKTEVDALKSS